MIIICGIDEAGRGPLAGPVTAAAVTLAEDFPKEILKDSKKLSPAARERICKMLLNSCCYGIGWVWPQEIDSLNIHNATLLAMKRAFCELKSKFEAQFNENCQLYVMVDGLFVPDIESAKIEAIVKGDDLIDEIKAASIIAKTARDRWMIRYSWIEQEYEFEKHKGYPTARHRAIIGKIGPSAIQRKSFTVKTV